MSRSFLSFSDGVCPLTSRCSLSLSFSKVKHNRCSCGCLIVHVRSDEDGRPLSPRHQTVFNRLYRHRLAKELHHRKLAAEHIEKEARGYIYIPLTNNVRRELQSTSSLSGIAHRERRIEMAREQFNRGRMCVECLKKVEIGTGTFVLDEEVSILRCYTFSLRCVVCVCIADFHVLVHFSFSPVRV